MRISQVKKVEATKEYVSLTILEKGGYEYTTFYYGGIISVNIFARIRKIKWNFKK